MAYFFCWSEKFRTIILFPYIYSFSIWNKTKYSFQVTLAFKELQNVSEAAENNKKSTYNTTLSLTNTHNTDI